jgi:arylsulfatase A-like enzyme
MTPKGDSMNQPPRLFVATFALFLLCTSLTHAAETAKQPNIVFIFTDDHAAHAISAYGSKINKTPNIDRIANAGMKFENCFVTNSICGPSRACILSGKYSHKNGFFRNGNKFDGEQWTFPKELQKVGYETAMIGKWHLSSHPTGFNFWEVLPGQGAYYNPGMIRMGERVKHTGYTTDLITDITLNWLKNKRTKDKPFMLMFQHKAPHRNWQPGPKHLTMYDDVTIPEPATLWDDYSGRTKAASQQAMTIAKHLNPKDLKLTKPGGLTPEQLKAWNAAYGPKNEKYLADKAAGKLTPKQDTQWKYQRYIKDYLRCVASVDDNIGRVLKYLKDNDLEENTIVIYSSDQGWYLGDHGWYDKRWMYEESLKMPFVIKWPGVIKAGTVNQALISNVDFAATFLDMAGAANPGNLQGKSIVPLLKGADGKDFRKSFYYHYYEFPGAHSVAKHYGVRTNRYKLIHFYRNKDWELFDLQSDPNELKSVYNDPAYAKIKAELKAELTRLQKELDEPTPEIPVTGDPELRQNRKKNPRNKNKKPKKNEPTKTSNQK